MARHRIAVISDTHSLLRPEIREVLATCEVILHGGDIAEGTLVEELQQIAPAYFVRGNADKEWAEYLPEELDVTLYGFHFYMVHNKKHMREDMSGVDVAIYGHSHKYEELHKTEVLYLNPGSCGPRRFHQPVTMAVMTIDEEAHTYTVECVDCSPVLGREMSPLPTKDMARLIRSILKDMNAGKTLEVIARRNRVEETLVSQILQIYTTHPGIDVDGILNRMDILGKL
ncbi:MAG: metallophosphoesterase family protein [Lachnospiraceae bacterium]|nr:metallophosphoesterase family protein [Lachnospiraceae bacterium]